jgi:DNA-binding transcriptional ArsR family regulator
MLSDEPHVDEMTLAAVMAALSDPMRVAIVRQLAAEGERTCGTFELGISKATRSHHFRVLREAGITHTRAEGTHRHVSLRRGDVDARFPGLLGAVLAAAEREAAARGRIREAILQTTEAAAQPLARIV